MKSRFAEKEKKHDIFHFKQFSIIQSDSVMKVGTDAVLLGAWVELKNANTILDIGSGTGLIACMTAQRNVSCKIDAIDKNISAYELTLQNMIAFKQLFSQAQIQCFHASLEEWILFSNKKYDLLLCNPPFFLKGYLVSEKKREMARAAEHLSFNELLLALHSLLNKSGKLAIIYPVYEAELFLQVCSEAGFFCRRKTIVFSKEQRPAKRIVLEIVKYACDTDEQKLIIEHAGLNTFTDTYKQLTGDFYLKF